MIVLINNIYYLYIYKRDTLIKYILLYTYVIYRLELNDILISMSKLS